MCEASDLGYNLNDFIDGKYDRSPVKSDHLSDKSEPVPSVFRDMPWDANREDNDDDLRDLVPV